MRSTLLKTGILVDNSGSLYIDLQPKDARMRHLMDQIKMFVLDARANGRVCFSQLYHQLCSPDGHIGLRKGLIPIYLAAVCHEFKKELIIEDKSAQVPITADTLLQINASPAEFYLTYLEWNPEKEAFVQQLELLFGRNVINAEKTVNSYDYVISAMKRWYMALPRYTKGIKRTIKGERVDSRYIRFINLLRQSSGSHELLFKDIPEAFGYSEQFTAGVAENIAKAKQFFDECVTLARKDLSNIVKKAFALKQNEDRLDRLSLTSVIEDWCDSLNSAVFEQIFADGTEKCLGLFRTITADEDTFIARLAKVTTGLRIEDWDDSTRKQFTTKLKQYRNTAETFQQEEAASIAGPSVGYQVSYLDGDGSSITKRFEHVEISSRAKLLFNTIIDEVDSMGRSISEQEKRQVLMEVLKKML